MTTMVISTMTFSWCQQVGPVTPTLASPTGQVSIQSTVAPATGTLAPASAPGGYEFATPSAIQRSPAHLSPLHIPRVLSTLATVIVPSSLGRNPSKRSKTAFCGRTGDVGNFTLNFDDISRQGIETGEPTSVSQPYHRFWYTGDFKIVPASGKAYLPSSGGLMLQYTPSSISNNSAYPHVGVISVGALMHTPCFHFDFTGVNLGCDSKDSCSFTFTGYQYDPARGKSVFITSQKVKIPGCAQNEHCPLNPVRLGDFKSLSAVTIDARVKGKPTVWWADDFALGWSQGDCESGVCRSRYSNNAKRS
ncbi:hypothetical protein GGS20DRAFT_579338 [Poronia punctata]|nr:hypothetical protein GGS20DRAFT_579338 [Poronia punctata]